MRNKGFFWFLTILLTIICVYQLSFTWVSNKVESKANSTAKTMVEDLRKLAAKDDSNKAILPNGVAVYFDKADAGEIAQAAYVNQLLKEKAETAVYPIFGSTFSQVKKRSLAFGLDLVGGMAITMEVSIPDLIKNFARSERDLTFKKPYESASAIYERDGGDFIDIFVAQYRLKNGSTKLVKAFAIADIEELGMKSTDEEVIKFLKEQVAKLPRTIVVTEKANYLYVECRSALFGFVDDLEFHLQAEQGLIAVRSAARTGHYDFGANRQRIEELRAAILAAQTSQ